ncbi:LacI family DNA-binding transcriptional regulator [Aestuariicoccus sp. MJ-SS9]|uniref:LacI family DNA-binding transcriptional regulator n=1 Tax=Aestuariicoccus sp. MJ-SS9 TaxID=3079855 RepID=UPI0029156CC5|nr:LacI family DNA-binding transcriptional regulator [Aestuariicoccus sp. MJ-SS9]MDU8911996.1 LacI family DNA-binding transcriptional regulator [Aestuariicoccus sp. MJ-SS9]
MARRPTLKDLARAAGVGVATVDRVLNGRPHVREATIARVAEAAARIGYPTPMLEARQAQAAAPRLRFGFVLHKGAQEFYRNFARELEQAVAARTDLRASCEIRFSPSQAPSDFAAEIEAAAGTCDVIATSAINHPSLTDTVQRVTASGVPVFALLNDFAPSVRQNYLGLDNMRAGRIAAWMIVTQLRDPGKLALFVGGNRWHGHLLRETGFQSYLRECAPGFTLLDTKVNLETRQVTYEATLDLLNRHPDLRGIYVAGGGMEGAIAALRELRPPGKVALVVNELTSDSRRGLADRYVSLVIGTPLASLCRDLVGLMAKAAGDGPNARPGQHFLTPELYCPESV